MSQVSESEKNRVGTVVSHYRILEWLGKGGMGVVYKALDLRLNRVVVLKFLPDSLAHDSEALARFQREARLASKLNHPNICTIYDVGGENGSSFIEMEYLDGKSLKQLLTPGAALPLDTILRISRGVLDGLQAAHEKGILHRDVKPANIFVTNLGTPKLLDFGLAKTINPTASQDVSPTASQDVSQSHGSGSALGTLAYMSPEQALGKPLDARSDFFSFGSVLYEMSTGASSFSGETNAVVLLKLLQERPIPPAKLNRSLPWKLEQIINRCLQKDRDRRYQSAGEILADLQYVELGSPQPTILRRLLRSRWKFTAAIAIVALFLIGLFLVRRTHQKHLTTKGTVVVADFTNTTGDAIFDTTLRQAATADLEQSPLINALPERSVAATLRQMAMTSRQRVTQDVARQVCLRTNSQAFIAGIISRQDHKYVLKVEAKNCETQAVLGVGTAEAASKSDVLKSLAQADTKLRRQLGETIASIKRTNRPIEEATTSSLQAWQAYSEGLILMSSKSVSEALPDFKRAVELDPNFARAHATLGNALFTTGQVASATQEYKRAYELRHRVGERERLYIETLYYLYVERDSTKVLQAAEQWAHLYPGDNIPYNRIGLAAMHSADYLKAAQAYREAIQLAPQNVLEYSNLMNPYILMDRYDEARATYDAARSRGLDSELLRINRYVLAFLEGDENAMQEQMDFARGKSGLEDRLLKDASDAAAYHGRYRLSLSLTDQAVASALTAQAKERATEHLIYSALRSAEIGDNVRARKIALDAWATQPGQDSMVLIRLALALSGDNRNAKKVADQLKADYPLDKTVQKCSVTSIYALISLNNRDYTRAIETLKPAVVCEMVSPFIEPAYIRGLVYLKLQKGNEAAAEFAKIVTHPGIMQMWITGALAQLQLARANAMAGNREQALGKYEDFLAKWKVADSDLAILKGATAEYLKLKRSSVQ